MKAIIRAAITTGILILAVILILALVAATTAAMGYVENKAWQGDLVQIGEYVLGSLIVAGCVGTVLLLWFVVHDLIWGSKRN